MLGAFQNVDPRYHLLHRIGRALAQTAGGFPVAGIVLQQRTDRLQIAHQRRQRRATCRQRPPGPLGPGAQHRVGIDPHRLERGDELRQLGRDLFGQAGTDHHRQRALGHDLAQEGQLVHARHLDVEEDHVRQFAAAPCGRSIGVGGGPHHLEAGIAGNDVAEDAPHRGGIVDDQDAPSLAGKAGWKVIGLCCIIEVSCVAERLWRPDIVLLGEQEILRTSRYNL